MQTKWTYEYIVDILENHDVELAALNRQLETLGATLEADLEEIRNRVYPGAIRYDLEKSRARLIRMVPW